MYFTELIVKAFGLHEDITVKFTPGLNVIVGESETGKTTLIRALYLLIENQPRGGEKLYHCDWTDDPVDIQLTNNIGNTVRRKNNKYYLNGGRPLKAFGASVPEPIRQLFNFKEINWQKQLDTHYLLFATGGSAGKLLNKSTGMLEQEAIVAEIKDHLSTSKSEIKRLKKNNIEHQATVDRLKKVTRYRLKSEAILYLKEKTNQLENKALKLELLLAQIEEVRESKAKFNQAKPYINKLNKLMDDYHEVHEYKNYCTKFGFLLTKINQIHIVKPELVSKYSDTLQTLHSIFLEYISMDSKIKSLEVLVSRIESAKESHERLEKLIKRQQQKVDEEFIELGYCPFCNRKVYYGDTCCS